MTPHPLAGARRATCAVFIGPLSARICRGFYAAG